MLIFNKSTQNTNVFARQNKKVFCKYKYNIYKIQPTLYLRLAFSCFNEGKKAIPGRAKPAQSGVFLWYITTLRCT